MAVQPFQHDIKVRKDKSLNKLIDRRLIYFGRWALGSELGLLLAGLVFGAFAGLPALLAWGLSIALCLLSAAQAYQILSFDAAYGHGPLAWRKRYLATQLAQTCLLGIVCAVLVASQGPGYVMLVTGFAAVCFTSAASESYAPMPHAYTRLICALTAPIIVACVYLQNGIGLLSACGLCILLMLSLHHSKKSGANFWQRHTATFLLRQKLNDVQAEKKIDEANLQLNHEFLNNLGLELKTSLNEVITATSLLKDSHPSEPQRQIIAIADKAGDRQLELVNQVIDYTRIATQRLSLEPVIFSLRRELETTIDELAFDAEERNIELSYTIAHDIPDRLKGDIGRIKQIFKALANNVIRFSERGEIFIEVTFNSHDQNQGELYVSIADQGASQLDADQNTLFNAFARIRHTKAGTGLGLAISKGIAECMGGRVGIGGQSGRGREFWFAVPVEIKPNQSLQFAANAKLQNLELLIVNAPTTLKSYLGEELAQWGLNVRFEAGNRKVIELLQLEPNRYCAALLFSHRKNTHIWDIACEISTLDNLERFPLFVAASNREIRKVVSREFILQHPYLSVIQKPVHTKQFHQLLVQELFQLDFSDQPAAFRIANSDDLKPGSKILLVEDHRVNQLVAENMLKKLGYQAQIANNGKEALELLESGGFDLVLMDCQMAEMDGYTATERIRKREIDKNISTRIPIIALTAHTAEEDRSRCLAVGMDDYLPKPVRLGELETRLKQWLGENRPVRHH